MTPGLNRVGRETQGCPEFEAFQVTKCVDFQVRRAT